MNQNSHSLKTEKACHHIKGEDRRNSKPGQSSPRYGLGVWLVSVNMGYGHQRTAYPLGGLAFSPDFYETKGDNAFEKIINANSYPGIPKGDRKIWESTRGLYELISNFKRIPVVGDAVFSIFDAFQRILSFYPKRDLSRPNFSLKQIYALFKRGWGRDLIQKISSRPLPLITTFFMPAFMAEFFNYPGEIFCVVCDADISRSWAPISPKVSRIRYFVPTQRVVERLKLYGVRKENIFFSGYPLPTENIGSENLEILKDDLRCRLINLDPQKRYYEKYKVLIESILGGLPSSPDHPLTILFSVGGAGAQKDIAIKAVKSLAKKIKAGEVKIILSAGIREGVKKYFEKRIENLKLKKCLGKTIETIYADKIENYFREFNQKLRKTDILWTKPSELSFYAALGIPIILAPTIGSQEDFNKRWLLKSGFGISQENPAYTEDWLFDWLKEGYLAEAAIQGLVEGEKLGTFKILRIIQEFGCK